MLLGIAATERYLESQLYVLDLLGIIKFKRMNYPLLDHLFIVALGGLCLDLICLICPVEELIGIIYPEQDL